LWEVITVRKNHSLLLLPIILGAILCTAFNQSTKAAMVELNIEQLVVKSSDVVGATVLGKVSYWNSSKTFIFTRITLRVDEALKGSLPVTGEIYVVVPGGEVEETGLKVEHAAQFETGEKAIVFLNPEEDSAFNVTGWEQGKYTIENEKIRETGLSVDEFKKEIRQALK
jgi:hypothetical protein